jgi:hypothetical protein
MKKCCVCKEIKDLELFSKDKKGKFGLQGKCKLGAKLRFRDWYTANGDATRASKRQYKKIKSDKINTLNAKRRASKLLRTPAWLTEAHLNHIELFYQAAVFMRNETNINFDVDHIVPLQGENVSGLHVPWNLQVITSYENGSKSNRLSREN